MINSEELRMEEGLVYHYTKASTALEHILRAPMKLRLGHPADSNDPSEARIHNVMMGPPQDVSPDFLWGLLNAVNAAWADVRVACFCTDAVDSAAPPPPLLVDPPSRFGWARDRMWAQYADGHRGICLALRRASLMTSFQSALGQRGECLGDVVSYRDDQRGLAKPDFGEAARHGIPTYAHLFRRAAARDVYFRKRTDWRDEREFRLILMPTVVTPDDAFVPIENSLAWLVVGARFPDVYRAVIQEVCTRTNVSAYQLRYQGLLALVPYCTPRGS